MDTMKLQKLTYYAQAWHLAWAGRPLFSDRIEAWANGPVIPSLFAAHRGRYSVAPGEIGGMAEALSRDEQVKVRLVLGHYGAWTGAQLSELSHSEDPWKTARAGLAPNDRGHAVIDPMLMQDYYGSLARRS